MIFAADFKLMAKKYKKLFGSPCSKDIRIQNKYKVLCEEFGESLVLAAFDEYARANSWRKNPPPALYLFFSECAEWISDVRDALKENEAEKKDADKYEQAMIADRVAARARIEKELEQRKKEKDAISRLPKDAF